MGRDEFPAKNIFQVEISNNNILIGLWVTSLEEANDYLLFKFFYLKTKMEGKNN